MQRIPPCPLCEWLKHGRQTDGELLFLFLSTVFKKQQQQQQKRLLKFCLEISQLKKVTEVARAVPGAGLSPGPWAAFTLYGPSVILLLLVNV